MRHLIGVVRAVGGVVLVVAAIVRLVDGSHRAAEVAGDLIAAAVGLWATVAAIQSVRQARAAPQTSPPSPRNVYRTAVAAGLGVSALGVARLLMPNHATGPSTLVQLQDLEIACPAGWTSTIDHNLWGKVTCDGATLDAPGTAFARFSVYQPRLKASLSEYAETTARHRLQGSNPELTTGPAVSTNGPALRIAAVPVATIVQDYDTRTGATHLARRALFAKLERPTETVLIMVDASVNEWTEVEPVFRSLLETTIVH